MKNLFKFLLLFMSYSCTSQNNPNSQDYLPLFRTHFPILEGDDWEVLVEWKDKKELTIYASKFLSTDTLLGIRVHQHIISDGNIFYEFRGAHKEFNLESDNNYADYQELDSNLEILYWYKYNQNDESQKDFILGKYYYQYLEGFLNENQQKYFLLHKDSLVRISGNNLPLLPGKM